MKVFLLFTLLLLVTAKISRVNASPTHSFSSGEAISSSKVNANFTQADTRLTALEARAIVKFVSIASPVTNQAVTVPAGATAMSIEGTGGGGGGGGGNCSVGNGMGGNGGSSRFGKAVVSVSPSDTIIADVGSGGTGGTSPVSCTVGYAGTGQPGTLTQVLKNGNAVFSAAAGTGGTGSHVPGSCGTSPDPSVANGTTGAITGALVQYSIEIGRGIGGVKGTGCNNAGSAGEDGFLNILFY